MTMIDKALVSAIKRNHIVCDCLLRIPSRCDFILQSFGLLFAVAASSYTDSCGASGRRRPARFASGHRLDSSSYLYPRAAAGSFKKVLNLGRVRRDDLRVAPVLSIKHHPAEGLKELTCAGISGDPVSP